MIVDGDFTTHRKSERHQVTNLHDVDFSTRPLVEENEFLLSGSGIIPCIVETRLLGDVIRWSRFVIWGRIDTTQVLGKVLVLSNMHVVRYISLTVWQNVKG